MGHYKTKIFALAAASGMFFCVTQGLQATTFSNLDSISIPASGTAGIASPYPSTIDVSGLTGTITDLNVMISGLSHTFPDDIDILLVGPGGEKLILMSDAGGPHDVSNITLTFDDQAGAFLPNGDSLVTGTFKPTNYVGNGGPTDIFPAPAPVGPYDSLLSVFNGLNPNGTWSLFVVDDQGADAGQIANGWSLDIATAIPEPAAFLLLGAGVLALVLRARKSKSIQ